MPIPVTCQCGQSFAAGDHLAGRTVQCPKCKSPLTIPNPQAAGVPGAGGPSSTGGQNIFDEAGMRTFAHDKPHCPSCNAELQPNAILCVKCGYHMQLGRKIGQDAALQVSADGHGATAHLALQRAARVLDEEKEEAAKKFKEGMPWWAMLGIFLFAMTFLVAMLMLPGDQSMLWGGVTILIVCQLIALYHSIRILIIAFSDNVVHGLCCLFVPCYMFIYTVMHWDVCGGHFIWQFLMGLISNIGVGMMGAAPYLKQGEGADGVFLPHPAPAIALVIDVEEHPLPRALA